MSKLVRLWQRPTYDGKRYTYYLIYYDEDGRRRQKALGHADKRKAERRCAQFAQELTQGIVKPGRMRLSELLEDYLQRTRTQIEVSTANSAAYRMNDFIAAVGNIYADNASSLPRPPACVGARF